MGLICLICAIVSDRQRMSLSLPKLLSSPVGNRVLFFFLAVVVGVVVALATVGLIELIALVQLIGFGRSSEAEFASIAAEAPAWRVVAAPLIGGLVVGTTIYLLPGQRYHGIADVMEACAFNSGRMGVRSGLGAAFAAGVSLGVGAPVGREGPAVHIGASISAWLAERLGLNRSQSLALLGCGAAAAVTTSFNAPIAGVLFALEVIVGYYTLRVFAPVVVASVAAVVVRDQFFGSAPLFAIPSYSLFSLAELPYFALLGVIGALLVKVFIALVAGCQNLWSRTGVPIWMRPAVAGLIIGLIALQYPMLLSVGYEPVDLALREQLPIQALCVLLILKLFGTALALGSGFAGGVFSPSVFIGAMLGGFFWFILGYLPVDTVSAQGVYSIVGIAGIASAMLGAPISTVLIVFEVTRSYEVTVAVMLSAAFASTVMQLGKHSSFFRWQLGSRGVNISAGRDVSVLMTHHIGQLLTQRYTRVGVMTHLKQVESQLGLERRRVAFVMDENNRFVGSMNLRELVGLTLEHGADQPVSEHTRDRTVSVTPETNLVSALQMMAEHDIEYLPVLNPKPVAENDSDVLGIVFKADVLHEHYEVLRKAREEEFGVN